VAAEPCSLFFFLHVDAELLLFQYLKFLMIVELDREAVWKIKKKIGVRRSSSSPSSTRLEIQKIRFSCDRSVIQFSMHVCLTVQVFEWSGQCIFTGCLISNSVQSLNVAMSVMFLQFFLQKLCPLLVTQNAETMCMQKILLVIEYACHCNLTGEENHYRCACWQENCTIGGR
jgi:hypothetical protein